MLHDPEGLLGADFDRIPASIMLDVTVRTAVLVRWAMQHRWILLPDEGSPDDVDEGWPDDVAPNPVSMEFASNGVVLVNKK